METIEYGSKISSEQLNKNFSELKNDIKNESAERQSENINLQNNINTISATLNNFSTNTTNSINAINNNVSNIQSSVSVLTSNGHGKPNWNAGVILANNINHSINQNGFILFRCSGVDQATWYINSNVVGTNYGFVTAWQDCNSGLFPVSIGDTARIEGSGLIQFFPDK